MDKQPRALRLYGRMGLFYSFYMLLLSLLALGFLAWAWQGPVHYTSDSWFQYPIAENSDRMFSLFYLATVVIYWVNTNRYQFTWSGVIPIERWKRFWIVSISTHTFTLLWLYQLFAGFTFSLAGRSTTGFLTFMIFQNLPLIPLIMAISIYRQKITEQEK